MNTLDLRLGHELEAHFAQIRIMLEKRRCLHAVRVPAEYKLGTHGRIAYEVTTVLHSNRCCVNVIRKDSHSNQRQREDIFLE